jgi:hypothetical protein
LRLTVGLGRQRQTWAGTASLLYKAWEDYLCTFIVYAVRVCVYVSMCTCAQVWMCACAYVCVCVCMCACAYACMSACASVCVCVCVCVGGRGGTDRREELNRRVWYEMSGTSHRPQRVTDEQKSCKAPLTGGLSPHQVGVWSAMTGCSKICSALWLGDITSGLVHLDVWWMSKASWYRLPPYARTYARTHTHTLPVYYMVGW